MKLKRIVLYLLIIVMLISSFPTFAGNSYATRGQVADMLLNAADFYNPYVSRGDIIKGYEDGQLREEKFVTRAEALVMLGRAFGSLPEPVGHNARVSLTAKDFTDIPEWAQNELSNVFDSGIVAGTSAGKFSPDNHVTEKQMKLFIQRVYSLYGTNLKDDFYAAVNKEVLENMHIAPGNVSSGTFETMQSETAMHIDGIVNMLNSGGYPEGSAGRKAADFYKCIVDTETRNKTGIKPIKKYLEAADNVKNITELTYLHDVVAKELYITPFIGFGLTVDLDDNSKYVLHLGTFCPGMNKELYSEENEKSLAYIDYIKTILILGGEDSALAQLNAQKYFEFEKELSRHMLSAEESQNLTNIYELTTYNKISAGFPDFDLNSLLEIRGLSREDKVVVSDMKLMEKFAQMYKQSNIDVLKTAMKVAVLTQCGPMLNEEFLKADISLKKAIFGIEESYDMHQYALAVLQQVMPEYIGQFYVESYFDEESKSNVENLTNDIIETFKERIDALSWMSEETKEKAKLKLDTLNVKIGYPEIDETYLDDVKIIPAKRGGTYFGNMLEITKAAASAYGEMQFGEVDHSLWTMAPYTVNAAYNPTSNDITLPAAILRYPLYQKNAAIEENLGGIGYLIAHEITHAFDSNGAKFDENGVVNNWWTDEDYAAFELLCDKVVKFFDGQEAIPAVQNNGMLTLNENIADLGAVACITQLAEKYGNIDFEKLYKAIAGTWQGTSYREYAEYMSGVDNHSSGKLRVNRILVNFEEFYKAFDIKENDGMYVPPEERISVW